MEEFVAFLAGWIMGGIVFLIIGWRIGQLSAAIRSNVVSLADARRIRARIRRKVGGASC